MSAGPPSGPVHGPPARPAPEPFPVVGIGASLGGIEALRTFFAAVGPRPGAAFLVLLTPSQGHDSQLAAVLRSVCSLPVTPVTERVRVEPNHVYVVPPDRRLQMEDGDIFVVGDLTREGLGAAIDSFLGTLAEAHGRNAVAAILSGSGADGSAGLKRVKELGGGAFCQEPAEAKFAEMPSNAIATGSVDDVLPAAQLPARIAAYSAAMHASGQDPEDGSEPLEGMTYGDLHHRLLESYAPPSLVVNESYDIVHLSDKAGRYLRLAGGEPSRNLLDLVRPELRAQLRNALDQAARRRANVEARNLRLSPTESVDLEVRPVLRQDDGARGFLLILFSEVEPGGEPPSTVVTQPVGNGPHDETPVSDHLENLLTSSGMAIVLLDRHLRLSYFSAGARSLFDLAPADIGRPFDEVTARLEASILPLAEAVQQDLQPLVRDVRTSDGRTFAMRMQPYRTPDAQVSGVVVSFYEITERQRAEKALRRSEQRLHMTVDASSEAVFRLNADWSQLLSLDGKGFLPDVTEPRSGWLEELVPARDRQKVVTAVEQAVSNRSMFELEHRVIDVNGSVGWVFSRALPVLGADEQVTGWFGTARDITKRRRAETDLVLLAQVGHNLMEYADVEEALRWLARSIGQHFGVTLCALDLMGETAGGLGATTVWSGEGGSREQEGFLTARLYRNEMAHSRRAGEAYALRDTTKDEGPVARQALAVGIRALLSVPLIHEGAWRFNVTVADAQPHVWTDEDVRLLREVAIRIWTHLERVLVASALQEMNETLERRVAERTEEWLKSQERFRHVFESGPMAAVITSHDEDRFIEVNAAFCRLTGYGRDELIGRTAHELNMWSGPDDRDKLRKALAKDASGFRELELSLTTRGGAARSILGSGGAIEFAGARCWLKMFVDITLRKHNQEELLLAIQHVMQDTAWFSRGVVERVADLRSTATEPEAVELTPRERQVLGLVARGRTDVEIAEALGLSRQTIRNYVANIYGKLHVNSRAQAVVWARERGIVD